MDDLIREKLEGRNAVILGFGREGQSTFKLIRKVLPSQTLTIADTDESVAGSPLLKDDENIRLIFGENYLDELHRFDLIIKSPGITLKDTNGRIAMEKITSQTNLFLEAYAGQVIGVTGTKGKSTTATLIYHILKHAGKDAILLGNIGRPAFNYVDDIRPDTKIVFELSSHQLEYITVAPRISILLNLYQEHLDAYHTFKEYCLAKWNIVKWQNEDDHFIFNADDPKIRELMDEFRLRRNFLPFSLETELADGCYIMDGFIRYSEECIAEKIIDLKKKIRLRGEHNLKNIMAAVAACKIAGTGNLEIEEGVLSFRGLEHRMEYVGNYRGIEFYDDSISTIPESCMEAVKALETVDTLILGGFDRGVDYSGLASFLLKSGVRNFIFTGEAGKKINEAMKNEGMKNEKNYFVISRFDEYIDIAIKNTEAGKICLLSPAAASYDEFVNFEERGKKFKELAGK